MRRRFRWEPERFVARLTYYCAGVLRDLMPDRLVQARARRAIEEIEREGLLEGLRDRVDYYNKLERIDRAALTTKVGNTSRSMSRYYFDFMETAAGFGRDRHLNYLFGDVVHVPNRPTIVKSRPISPNNANAVLLNLDRLRHFRFPHDPVPFEDKLAYPVWRGAPGNPTRNALLRRFHNKPRYDVGHTGAAFDGILPKAFLTIEEQRRHRYIISLEGNDVATNLKWVLSSNSLCFSPSLTCEIWFMEGTLRPDVHYVEIRPDFLDLEEKVDFYTHHVDAAQTIIRNAHAHVRRFQNKKKEQMMGLLVMQKYFELSDQLPDHAFPIRLFTEAAKTLLLG